MRPLIGISSYREQARWGSWDVPAVLLPAAYVDAVTEAGGAPVVLPTGAFDAQSLARFDGLVLAGGADIDPAHYGQISSPHTSIVRVDRDKTELELLSAALERNLPILAICRGMQLLNVALGGDLVQHLPDVPGASLHDPGPGLFAEHQVRIAAGSRLQTLLGGFADVHCHHHQAIGRLAPTLSATAWAQDRTVEAVEEPNRAFCVGVQWHPEAGPDRRLFVAHVEAATNRA